MNGSASERFSLPPRGAERLPDSYFGLEMSEAIDWPRVPVAAAAEAIALRAGELFSNDPKAERFLRLAWAHLPERDIEAGMALLGKVLGRYETRLKRNYVPNSAI